MIDWLIEWVDEWMRMNKKQFDYVFENKDRKYTPDFYLPGTNEYVEIKGYKNNAKFVPHSI